MIYPGVGMTLGAVFIGREQAVAFFCRSPWDLPVMESTRVVEYPVNTATAGLGLIKIGTFSRRQGTVSSMNGVFNGNSKFVSPSRRFRRFRPLPLSSSL